MMEPELARQRVEAFRDDFSRLETALGSVLVGQEGPIRELLTAVFAGGHVLLEGLPGLGKTQLVKALAVSASHPLTRIQCTPDLMPSDVVGSEVLVPDAETGERELRFRPGPVFAPLLLVDEINRATARTQSALLEAMGERQVTVAGRRHPLPSPFWVVATQNPIELEGTYPLPEAQLDRFFFQCRVPYPGDKALLEIAEIALDEEPAERLEPLLAPARIREMMELAREVVVPELTRRDAVDLVLATQPERPESDPAVRRHLRCGASPRALQTLLRAARVRALAHGRGHVDLQDLRAVALPTLRHRVLLSLESQVEGTDVDGILTEISEAWVRSR